MRDESVSIAGELLPWPARRHLASILRDAGLKVTVGQYSVRVDSCSHFSFENYGGDICEPTIYADADSLDEMMRDAQLVSAALTRGKVKHRFELYDSRNQMVGYLHHDWPLPGKDQAMT
jgi:hypothetical protein